MATIEDFGEYETAWCPGCGNFPLLKAVKKALATSGLEPFQILFVSGIGQAAKAPHYLNVNVFNGLHGRSLPVATAAKLANPGLTVIAQSGDGCNYGEGGNHFLAAIRRNPDITLLVHDNQIYGLTKGQASPTTIQGTITKAQPFGYTSEPFNPVAVAVAMRAGFVARGYAAEIDHLAALILQALGHRGFSIVDILQPCVSFNKVNTYQWYRDRCHKLPEDYDPEDFDLAFRTAMQWGETIPIGVIYKNDRPPLENAFHDVLALGPLVNRGVDRKALAGIMEKYY